MTREPIKRQHKTFVIILSFFSTRSNNKLKDEDDAGLIHI